MGVIAHIYIYIHTQKEERKRKRKKKKRKRLGERAIMAAAMVQRRKKKE
jgi:hypothetical protein